MKNKNLVIRLIIISLIMLLLFSIKDFSFAEESNAEESKIYETITSDDVRIKSLKLDTIDGTPGWDKDDKPGNDSGPSNKIVRSFDRLSYNLTFTTESKTNKTYKNGRVYFEAELPVGKDKARFDVEAMEGLMDSTEGYEYKVEVRDGKQILKCYYQISTGKDDQGKEVYPFPSMATFPIYIKVNSMNNGETLQPKFKVSVAYSEDSIDKVTGEYNKPIEVVSENIKITAEPRYNVEIVKADTSRVGAVDVFNFNTGDNTALNKEKNEIYGRIQGYVLNIQLNNPASEDGLKGIELPGGDINIKMKVSSRFIGESGKDYGMVEAPIIWGYGNHNYNEMLNNRDIKGYGHPLIWEGPTDDQSTEEFYYIDSANTSVWNGGKWNISQNNQEINVKVKDYIINPEWFPSGTIEWSKKYYDFEKTRVENIGVFSSGAIYMVVPFGGSSGVSDEEYYSKKFGENGSLKTRVEVVELDATSKTGQKTSLNSGLYINDHRVITTVTLKDGVEYDQFVHFRKKEYPSHFGMDGRPYGEDYGSGTDAQVVGGDVGMSMIFQNNPMGARENSVYGLNSLLKFDDKVFELYKNESIEDVISDEGNYTKFSEKLFAAKPDGTGWKDDQEMNGTNEEDLVYYKTIEELEATGKVCVGILHEVRFPADKKIYANQEIELNPEFKLKEDAKSMKNTYMITAVSNVWRYEDYKKVLEANNGKFPSRLNLEEGEIIPNKSINTYKNHYGKAHYDDKGYVPGTGGEPYWGDTLYVLPYKAEIKKMVEQKNNLNNEKFYFNLSLGQNIVDYVLYPELKIPKFLLEKPETNYGTEVQIIDVLPVGLKYIKGSAIQGGTYKPNEDINKEGIVENGIKFEPNIVINTNGGQKLIWTIDNHKILDDIGPIHYKVEIDPFSKQGKQYVNVAGIKTTEDIRKQDSNNGNQYSAKIEVASPSLMIIENKVSKDYYKINEKVEYELRWINNSDNYKENILIMDVMPQNNDSHGSKYQGDYTLDELSFKLSDEIKNNEYKFYYTLDKTVEKNIAKDFNYEDFNGESVNVGGINFQKAELGADGKVKDIIGKEVTGWILIGDIGINKDIKANMSIDIKDNKHGDLYVNTISISDLEKAAKANVGQIYGKLNAEKIVKDEEGKVLKDGDKVKTGDILTYEVKVKNPTVYDMFTKITDVAPRGTSILLKVDGKPLAKLSNNGEIYVDETGKKLSTDVMKIKAGESITLEFIVEVKAREGKIKNIARVDNITVKEESPEEPGIILEPNNPESAEVEIENEDVLRAEIIFLKKWESIGDLEEKYNDIDYRQIIYFNKLSGLDSRVKGLVNGFSYVESKVFINNEEVASFKDSVTKPIGDKVILDEEILNRIDDNNRLRIVHYYMN